MKVDRRSRCSGVSKLVKAPAKPVTGGGISIQTVVGGSAAASAARGGQAHTRFERARIIGARALQLTMGAPVLVDPQGIETDPIEMAMREYAANLLPMEVRRKLD